MQRDKQFRVAGNWALASDGIQWIIQRKKGSRWEAVKFVRSTKERLAHCFNTLKIPSHDVETLLERLPSTFDEWRVMPPLYSALTASKRRSHDSAAPHRHSAPAPTR
jgi:hypothetical protein